MKRRPPVGLREEAIAETDAALEAREAKAPSGDSAAETKSRKATNDAERSGGPNCAAHQTADSRQQTARRCLRGGALPAALFAGLNRALDFIAFLCIADRQAFEGKGAAASLPVWGVGSQKAQLHERRFGKQHVHVHSRLSGARCLCSGDGNLRCLPAPTFCAESKGLHRRTGEACLLGVERLPLCEGGEVRQEKSS